MVLFSGSAVIVFLVGVQFSLADPSPCLHDHLHISDELQVIEHLGQESPIDVPEDAINGIIFVPDDSHYSGFAAETFEQMKPIRQIDVELPAGANLTAWPAPVITSVSKQKTTGGNLARFLMKWEISPRANLTGFRAMVCTPKCTSTSTTSTERKVIVKVPFVTKFNISVVALYKSPNASEPIESPSNISLYDSGVGLPSPVKRIKGKLENRDRSLKLTWDRPSSPNGPIDFYSVHVNDIINGAKVFWKQPATTEVVLNVTGTSGYGFEAILKAVNIDPDSKEEFTSEETRYSLTHVKLGKPAKVTAVSRWQSSITLQMSPPNSRKPFPFQVLFEIKGRGRAKKDYVTDLIIFDRLSPYQYVSVDVSACYLTATFKEYICGNSIQWSGRSNVAAPSPIPKVDIIQSANNDTQLKWTLPEKPNGPIDGFIVNRREIGDPPREWKNIRNLDSSARTVTIGREELLEGISYEFGVAAFNRDLQQNSQFYYSNLTIATLPARPTSPKTWIIPTVVFAVLVVLAGMGIGIYFHVRSGKPLPRVITFSKA